MPPVDGLAIELRKLINKKINDIKVSLKKESTIVKNHDVFSWSNHDDLGCTNVSEHAINAGRASPIKQMPRRPKDNHGNSNRKNATTRD